MRQLGLLGGGVVHEGHVVGDELLGVVRLRDGREDADGQRDGGGLGRVVEGLPDGDQVDERVRRVRLPPRAQAERLVPRVVSVLPATLGAVADAAVGALHVEVRPRGAELAVGQHDVGVVGESVKPVTFWGFLHH